MDLCQSRWEKKAHADDKLCNYSGSIFALLACSQELQWLIKQSKETPLTEVCIPRFSLIWEGDCLVLHSLMPSHLARADMNQQVHKMISKAVKTSFWNQILKQHSIAAFSSRARLLSASLGFFFFCSVHQQSEWMRSQIPWIKITPERSCIWFDVPQKQVARLLYLQEAELSMYTVKTFHCYRYKRSHTIYCSEDEKDMNSFYHLICATQIGAVQKIVFSGPD